MRNKSTTTYTGNIAILALSFLFLATGQIKAQSTADVMKYRVTAYKASDNSVTSVSNVSEVKQLLTIYVPGSFTPNNDGLNDEFGAVGKGIKTYNITIYNNWGEIVFQGSDINEKWDGKFKGQDAPSGAYLYTVSANGFAGGAEYRNGSVTLLR